MERNCRGATRLFSEGERGHVPLLYGWHERGHAPLPCDRKNISKKEKEGNKAMKLCYSSFLLTRAIFSFSIEIAPFSGQYPFISFLLCHLLLFSFDLPFMSFLSCIQTSLSFPHILNIVRTLFPFSQPLVYLPFPLIILISCNTQEKKENTNGFVALFKSFYQALLSLSFLQWPTIPQVAAPQGSAIGTRLASFSLFR